MRTLAPLRGTLALVAIVDLLAAYALLFAPQWVMNFYVVQQLDDLHRFLAMGLGSMLLVFTVGAVLAFIHPRGHKSMIVLLILSHFFPFVVDVIVLARGQMGIRQVLPEMIYFLVVTVMLVRFFPGKLKEVTQPEDQLTEQPPPEEQQVVSSEQ